MGRIHSICALCVLAVLPFAARGEPKDPESDMANAIARRYVALAGTRENALALALSLRNGERVMLVKDEGGAQLPVTTVFELPTRRMQWEDVGLCLALTEDSLAGDGVYRPSPEQLEASLLRVLQLLADGLEWKQARGQTPSLGDRP
jgi:hypothetical protein